MSLDDNLRRPRRFQVIYYKVSTEMNFINENEPPDKVSKERFFTQEEILAQLDREKLDAALEVERQRIRQRSHWSIGIGALIILAHVALVIYEREAWQIVFRSIFLIFGAIAFFIGLLDWREAKKMTVYDLIPSPEAQMFARQYAATQPYFTHILLGCCAVVYFFQMRVGLDFSIESASLYGAAVERGEWFRILTAGLLHGGILHIFMNGQALYNFGRYIETLSNRLHLATVFLLAVVGGNLLSLLLMPPDVPSVGASGGIMGLLGFLAVFGHRRKAELPPNFFRNVLTNLALIGFIGVIGFAFINNAAHFGGLIVGAIYGFLVISSDRSFDPKQIGLAERILGWLSLLTTIATVVFIGLRFGIF